MRDLARMGKVSLAVKLTAKDEDGDDAVMSLPASVRDLVPSSVITSVPTFPKLTTCVSPLTVKDLVTDAAAEKAPFPAWLATRVHVPETSLVTVHVDATKATEHTDAVEEVTVTARPLSDDTVRGAVSSPEISRA